MNKTDRLLLLLNGGAKPFPPIPSRDERINFQLTAQGLLAQIDGIGLVPIYEPGYQCLSNPSQRKQWRDAKKAKGDTHLILVYSTHESYIYREPNTGNYYDDWITPSAEQNPDWFLSLVEEVRQDGFIPSIAYDGDNGDNPNDGYPNALRQLPILYNLLKSSKYGNLNKHCIFLRFWDGVFYGSTPENIENFGTQFRTIYTDNDDILGIEFNVGHIPVGGGDFDYSVNGKMAGYDIVFAEFNNLLPRDNNPNPDDNPGTSIWQIVGRLAHPYIWPSDEPSSIDRNPPPFYLIPSARGRRVAVAFESGIYPWVRVDLNNPQPLLDIINNQNRPYLKSLSNSPNYRVS